ncbi:MAG TPA: zinc-ribbon domain-containing protein [Clostridiales bacterium]|nr:zinc-ribbon domain-containing protein [Clostridiales bacterium]
MEMLCSNCGKENTEGSAFCAYCGEKLKPEDNLETEAAAANLVSGEKAEPCQCAETTNTGTKPNADHHGFLGFRKKYRWFDFQNPVALILYIAAGVAVILGLIFGIYYGISRYDIYNFDDYYTGFSFETMFFYWLRYILTAVFLVAAGEIINLLQKILDKQKK